jgi:hypothetical protein
VILSSFAGAIKLDEVCHEDLLPEVDYRGGAFARGKLAGQWRTIRASYSKKNFVVMVARIYCQRMTILMSLCQWNSGGPSE